MMLREAPVSVIIPTFWPLIAPSTIGAPVPGRTCHSAIFARVQFAGVAATTLAGISNAPTTASAGNEARIERCEVIETDFRAGDPITASAEGGRVSDFLWFLLADLHRGPTP